MNGKNKPPKQRRRAGTKLNSKAEKGNLHHINKIIGKSKIMGSQRVTLVPGFLINGFATGTVKRARGRPPTQKSRARDHLLNENLQAFLEQKSHNLRRSQRIIEKHTDEHGRFSKSSGNNSGYEEDIDMRVVSPMPTSCIKSILKKKPKSIFKEISDKFSKVQNETRKEEEVNCYRGPSPAAQTAKQQQQASKLLSSRFEENFASSNHFGMRHNGDICENIMKKLRVTFRRNIKEECQQNMKKEIAWTNAALAGKASDKIEPVNSDNNSEEEPYERLPSPIPPKKWVYKTPGKHKPTLPPVMQNKLEPAVMCQQQLFEFNPGCAINYAASQNIPVENNVFLRRVTGAKGTPFRAPAVDHAVGYNGCFERYNRYDQVQSGMVLLPPPQNLNPMCANYHLMQNQVTMPPPPRFNDFCEQLNDLTFVDTGDNNYQAQSSQVAYDTNRQLSEEQGGYREWSERPKETNNMFDFSKQDTNMFNFGVL